MAASAEESPAAGSLRRPWYQRVGPGLITACVVIGPGSILTSSKVGATHGFAMSWVVIVAVFFMMIYTTLGARLGVVAGRPTGDLVTAGAGRWLAVLIGAGVFFISAAFQFGNNLGVESAFRVYVERAGIDYERQRALAVGLSVGFMVLLNGLSISFLFVFKNLYRAIERLMMAFVGLMLLSFALNLCFARPSPGEFVKGLVPQRQTLTEITVLGLVGTTFVITASFFQSYLVRQKGWGKDQLRDGMWDARVGAVLMALITLMIMSTSAAVLRGQQLDNVHDVAVQLEPLFGGWGQPLFCLGLFSAAYSSFLVNSMIGGFILADGLGLSSKPTDLAPRLLTTAVLLTGMLVAIYAVTSGVKPVAAIVAAQAVTVVAAPLMAGALLWLTSRRDVMGDERNGPVMNAAAGLGLVLLLAMAWYTATYALPENLK